MLPTTYPNSLWNTEPQQQPHFNADGYKRFMAENFTIIDKEKKEVPFVLKPAQDDFVDRLGQYYNVMVLKARKMGFSSAALGVAATKFITGRNEKCVSMSFDQDAADKQLSRAKQFIKSYEYINKVKVPLKYDTRSELVWEGTDEQGKPFTNILRVGTARNTSFGRGDDITFLHLTEVAFSKDVELLMASVGEAVVEGAHTILETTANGFNSYKRFWDAAMMNHKNFACLFYPPEWEYSDEYLAKRAAKLGRLFPQEYPRTPQEAFIASGDTYVDRLSLAQLLEQVQRYELNHPRVAA